MRIFATILGFVVMAIVLQAQTADPQAPFVPHPVATDIYGGEQLVAADVNHDGKPDLIALGRQMTQLVWFENPFWQRHTIMHGTTGMANLSASDIDGDGIPEIALAYGFGANSRQSGGVIAVLEHLGDPRGIWMLKNIHQIAPLRRVLWGDVEGNGQKALIDAPTLTSDPKMFEESAQLSTELTFYRPGEWQAQTTRLDDRDRARQLLISDSGDVVTGLLNGEPFFADAEGSTIWIRRKDPKGAWQSSMVDANLPNGRVLLAIDINSDRNYEIVASAADSPKKIYLYRTTDPDGRTWQRMILDETMAAGHCVAVEINADAKTDISCIDRTSPFSVHWYQNVSD